MDKDKITIYNKEDIIPEELRDSFNMKEIFTYVFLIEDIKKCKSFTQQVITDNLEESLQYMKNSYGKGYKILDYWKI